MDEHAARRAAAARVDARLDQLASMTAHERHDLWRALRAEQHSILGTVAQNCVRRAEIRTALTLIESLHRR